MKRLVMAVATGVALAFPVIAPAQAQQDRPAVTQPRADPEAQGIAPQQLQPDQIRKIQQALQDQGYYPGAVNGVWGPATASALLRYKTARPGQSESTRPPGNDRIDRETLSGLGLDPAQFGQDSPYAPSGPTGRRGSAGHPPSASPGAPPASAPPGTSPGSRPSAPGGSR
jgi:hypothetical protein